MVDIRVATADDWPEMHRSDGRMFGAEYSEAEQTGLAGYADPTRFRLAVDGGSIVGIAGSFALDMTVPGGASVPTAGVTWVSVAVTHRRRGLLRRLMDEIHADADERDEPLAALTASEGGIYERFGYGIATRLRWTTIDRRRATFRPDVEIDPSAVRLVDQPMEAIPELMGIWDRYRLTRAGEIDRTEAWWRWAIGTNDPKTVLLMHPDGFVSWSLDARWGHGHPAHTLQMGTLAAVTPEAHATLWHAVLSADLVGEVETGKVAVDDPLPYLLEDPRAVRTTGLIDGVWCHPRDVARCFGARTAWGTDDDVVVEAEGTRWRIGGGGTKKVRSRPDLATDRAGLGALLMGGVAPTTLARGRRLTARSADALRRADALLVVHPAPHCQTGF